jgi:putative oxidoreductase
MKITALIARMLLGFVFLVVVFLLQVIPAILLLVNRYVPLALTFLGPVLTNIALFHVFMAPAGLPLPIILSAFWLLVAYQHRAAFAGLFSARPHKTTDLAQA